MAVAVAVTINIKVGRGSSGKELAFVAVEAISERPFIGDVEL